MTWQMAIFTLSAGWNRPGHRFYREKVSACLPRRCRRSPSSPRLLPLPRRPLRSLAQPSPSPSPSAVAVATEPAEAVAVACTACRQKIITPGPPWLVTFIFSLARQFLQHLTANSNCLGFRACFGWSLRALSERWGGSR